jgi:iron complex transport system ATP-binding protein
VSHPRSAPAEPVITLSGVTFGYGRAPILDDLSLTIAPGRVTCVVGANGAGKTTLLKLMAGLLAPARGQVRCFGRDPRATPRRHLARRLAYVPQSYSLAFPFTASEVVLMGRYAHRGPGLLGLERDDDIAEARAAMERCDVLGLADRRFDAISGGEQRRVLLAQAFCQRAEVILLDEPTASLDPAHAIALFTALARERDARGAAAVVVTHDLNLAARFADRLLLLDDRARLAADGPPAEVLASDAAAAAFAVGLHVGRLPGTDTPFVVPT